MVCTMPGVLRMRNTDTLLIAVDAKDRETGVIEKMEAHRKGVLHSPW